MRANIERDSVSTTDAAGHPDAPVWAALATVPCYAWSATMDDNASDVKTATVETIKVMFPRGTDITAYDRIALITDRAPNPATLFAGPFVVDGEPQRREGRVGHVLVQCRRVGPRA